MAASLSSIKFNYQRTVGGVAVVGLLILGVFVFNYFLSERLIERYAPLVDAAMEIKLESTLAHLKFEERLTNDRDDLIEAIYWHLDQSDWYAQAMLDGGSNREGNFIALEDPELRAYIVNVRSKIKAFRSIMEKRWAARTTTAMADQYDQDFDVIFEDFISDTDRVETRIQDLMRQDTMVFKSVQLALFLFTALVITVASMMLLRSGRMQQGTMNEIAATNASLQKEIMRREKAERILKKQARTDSLTGLLNRRRVTSLMGEEIHRAKRLGTTFSVVIFDIDHFKAVNDTYGHSVGDQVLQGISELLTMRLREIDSFARWGGEEFLFLLPGTDLEGAKIMAEGARQRLSEHTFPAVGVVSASFGVAEYGAEDSIEDLIRHADEALYAAKDRGRNMVVSAASPR